MKFMLLLLAFGCAVLAKPSLPVNPGGIGGLFKGPNSETIIKGPDGSVITALAEGGAVETGIEPIVVAEPDVVESVVPLVATAAPIIIDKPTVVVETAIVDAPIIEPTQNSDLIGPSGSVSTRGSQAVISGPASTTITGHPVIAETIVKGSSIVGLPPALPVATASISHHNSIATASVSPIGVASVSANPLSAVASVGLGTNISPPLPSEEVVNIAQATIPPSPFISSTIQPGLIAINDQINFDQQFFNENRQLSANPALIPAVNIVPPEIGLRALDTGLVTPIQANLQPSVAQAFGGGGRILVKPEVNGIGHPITNQHPNLAGSVTPQSFDGTKLLVNTATGVPDLTLGNPNIQKINQNGAGIPNIPLYTRNTQSVPPNYQQAIEGDTRLLINPVTGPSKSINPVTINPGLLQPNIETIGADGGVSINPTPEGLLPSVTPYPNIHRTEIKGLPYYPTRIPNFPNSNPGIQTIRVAQGVTEQNLPPVADTTLLSNEVPITGTVVPNEQIVALTPKARPLFSPNNEEQQLLNIELAKAGIDLSQIHLASVPLSDVQAIDLTNPISLGANVPNAGPVVEDAWNRYGRGVEGKAAKERKEKKKY